MNFSGKISYQFITQIFILICPIYEHNEPLRIYYIMTLFLLKCLTTRWNSPFDIKEQWFFLWGGGRNSQMDSTLVLNTNYKYKVLINFVTHTIIYFIKLLVQMGETPIWFGAKDPNEKPVFRWVLAILSVFSMNCCYFLLYRLTGTHNQCKVN